MTESITGAWRIQNTQGVSSVYGIKTSMGTKVAGAFEHGQEAAGVRRFRTHRRGEMNLSEHWRYN